MQAAHDLLQLLMLRRLKESVVAEMPPKLETIVKCPLADAQAISLYMPLSPCISLYLFVSPTILPISPCISHYIPVSPTISHYLPISPYPSCLSSPSLPISP